MSINNMGVTQMASASSDFEEQLHIDSATHESIPAAPKNSTSRDSTLDHVTTKIIELEDSEPDNATNTMAITQDTATANSKTTIQSLPNELIFTLMDCMIMADRTWGGKGMCTAICLGITNRRFYKVLKAIHPTALGLHYTIWLPFSDNAWLTCDVKSFLRGFMTPKYRSAWLPYDEDRFVLCETYDEERGPKEWELYERFDDYHKVMDTRYPCFACWEDDHDHSENIIIQSQPFLPYPGGMGDTWYPAAIALAEQIESGPWKSQPTGNGHTNNRGKLKRLIEFTTFYPKYAEERYWSTWQGFWESVEGQSWK